MFKKKTPKYLNYYYMSPTELSAKELSAVILARVPQYKEQLECWDAAGVIEIELGEKSSIDIEKLPLFEDEADQKFLKKHQIQSIFSIQLLDDDLEQLKTIFSAVVSDLGGFVCADTENFQPYLISPKSTN